MNARADAAGPDARRIGSVLACKSYLVIEVIFMKNMNGYMDSSNDENRILSNILSPIHKGI